MTDHSPTTPRPDLAQLADDVEALAQEPFHDISIRSAILTRAAYELRNVVAAVNEREAMERVVEAARAVDKDWDEKARSALGHKRPDILAKYLDTPLHRALVALDGWSAEDIAPTPPDAGGARDDLGLGARSG